MGHVDALGILNGLFQLVLDLGLGFTEDVFDDALAGIGMVPCGIATFPAAILSLSDVALAVGAFF